MLASYRAQWLAHSSWSLALQISTQSRNIGTVSDEIKHITEWSTSKNLHISPSKTRELVVIRHNMPSHGQQPSVSGVKTTTTIKLLGVSIGEKLLVTALVEEIPGSCSSSLYTLKTLQGHRMLVRALCDVTRTTTMARLMYASPAWWEFLSKGEREHIQWFFHRMIWEGWRLTRCRANLADEQLFKTIKPFSKLQMPVQQSSWICCLHKLIPTLP